MTVDDRLRDWVKKIGKVEVIVQSCTRDRDGDLIANIGMVDRSDSLNVPRYEKVRVTLDDEIIYPFYVSGPVNRANAGITHEQFDKHLVSHLKEIREMIKGLIDPSRAACYSRAKDGER